MHCHSENPRIRQGLLCEPVAGGRSQELQAFLLWAVLVLRHPAPGWKTLLPQLNEWTKGQNSVLLKQKTITAEGKKTIPKLRGLVGGQKRALTLLFINLSHSLSPQILACVDFNLNMKFCCVPQYCGSVKCDLQLYRVWLLKWCCFCEPKGCRCGTVCLLE